MSLVYNPDVVVFQGDFAWADDYFDEELLANLKEFRYYPEGRVFHTYYDTRDLTVLDAKGGAELLKWRYFSSLDEQ